MAAFNKSDASMLRTAYELSAGMLSFVVAAGARVVVRALLDRWLGTSPWLTVVSSAFGFAAGALNVYRTVKRALTRRGEPGQRRLGGRD